MLAHSYMSNTIKSTVNKTDLVQMTFHLDVDRSNWIKSNSVSKFVSLSLTFNESSRTKFCRGRAGMRFQILSLGDTEPGAGIMKADDSQVTTVFTVQPSFHHRHSTNRVSLSVSIVGERAITPHLVVR